MARQNADPENDEPEMSQQIGKKHARNCKALSIVGSARRVLAIGQAFAFLKASLLFLDAWSGARPAWVTRVVILETLP